MKLIIYSQTSGVQSKLLIHAGIKYIAASIRDPEHMPYINICVYLYRDHDHYRFIAIVALCFVFV